MNDNSGDDSSEEEDDDDEEEAQRIRDGFIVEDEDPDRAERKRRRKSRKRKHRDGAREKGDELGDQEGRERRARHHEDDEILDDDDLDLVIESGGGDRGLKRLKRAQDRDLANLFDEDEELPDEIEPVSNTMGRGGEFDDFIEDDLSEDDIDRVEREQQERTRQNRPSGRQELTAANVGMDEDAYQDVLDVFGNGEDYNDALQSDEDEAEPELEKDAPDLKKLFEPSDLQSRMLTDADEIIRMTDEPERMQLARGSYREIQLDEEDFDWLCSWTHSQLWESFSKAKKENPAQRDLQNSQLTELHQKAVRDVLTFYTREVLEIPYIWNHRREYLECRDERVMDVADDERDTIKLISINQLWSMVALEVRFRSIVEKRDALKKTYLALDIEDPVFEGGIVNDALTSMQDVVDLHDYIYFHYSAEIRDMQATQSTSTYKRPASKHTLYEKARKSETYGLVQAFGITAHQFAENFSSGSKRHYAEDPDQYSEDLALTFMGSEYESSRLVLSSARNVYAQELLHDPVVRKQLRNSYSEIAEFSFEPTEKGIKQIDEFHPYYAFKYAEDLPISQLRNAPGMFLQMLKAEAEGVINISGHLKQEQSFVDGISEFMTSDNVSAIAEDWNKQRRDVVQQLVRDSRSQCVRFVIEELRSASEDVIAAECRKIFRNKMNQQKVPFRTKSDDENELPKVLAISNGHGNIQDAIVSVFVDAKGKQRQHQKYREMRTLESQASLREAIRLHRVDVIGISGFSPQTARLKADLETAISDLDGEDRPRIVYVNDEVARLYHDSPRARKEYPSLAPLYRYCIALAHYLQSPIHEYIALGEDLMQLNWHQHQNLIPQEKLWAALESAMVDMVNLIGVDINKAQDSVYEENLLQYVSGLGPRKANYLKRRIAQSGGTLSSRTELLEKRFLTRNIFVNCASAFRIRFSVRRFADHYARKDEPGITQLDILDETRIHPEDYELANKMAADAQDLDEEDVDALRESGGPVYLMRDKGEYERLDELILEDYANELFRAFNQPKLITLHMISRELQRPYEELRREFKFLTEDDVFTMLTGETSESMAIGAVVSAKIMKISDKYLLCKTESGIEVDVPSADMALPLADAKAEQHFKVNDAVRGQITSIDTASFKATMTLDTRKVEESLTLQKRRIIANRGDTKWDDFKEEKHVNTIMKAQEASQRTQRVIKHPLFKQFNARQAEEYLGSMQRGDAVIRPSSKGPDHIAVTWKVTDGIFQHLDILELDKDSTHSVGTKLKIGGATYSDLDELIVSHVKAMARKVDEINVHDKYQRGTKADVELYLSNYCQANPRKSCYAFCISHKHPGYFDLCFKASARAKIGEWPVKIIPNAFSMRDNVYADMTQLCNGFKMLFAQDSLQKR